MKKIGKTVILGGTGFIGSQLAAKLSKLCKKIIVISRNPGANQDLKLIPNLEILQSDITDERNLNIIFKDCELVINTIGILNEFNEDNTFEKLHFELTKKISRAIELNGVKRYLHISSLNADINASSKYLKTKGKAENYLLENTIKISNVTIFRPSIVFGEQDSFFNKFAKILKLAFIFPLACPYSKFMPIYVDDLTDFMISTISDIQTYGIKIDATGPKEYTFKKLIELTLRTLKIKRFLIPLNYNLSKLQAQVFQRLPGKIFTLDNFESLQVDSVSQNGFKGTSSVEDIIPKYLNISYNKKHIASLRKKSGRYK